MLACLEKRVCHEESEEGTIRLDCWRRLYLIKCQNMRSAAAAAEDPLDSGIRAVVVAEGQCCLTEKRDLEIVVAAVAADLAEGL